MNIVTRPRGIAALIAGAVVTAGVLLAPATASAADRVVLARGHVDAVDVHYTDGRLVLKVHDDTVSPSVTRDPADVTFQVLPQAATPVPDDPRFAFLGPAGSQVWLLPMTQNPDLLWPGWNTTELPAGLLTGNQVKLSLVDVSGPGNVSLFMQDAFGGPLVKFRSDDGLPDTIDVPVGTHAHANWAFTALGSYTLTWQAEGTLADGTPVSTGPVPYSFQVGDAVTEPGVALAVTGMAGGYQPGETVTLNAVQTPTTDLDHYHWFSRCPGTEDFAVVRGEAGPGYTFTATRELDGCEYLAKLYDDDHGVAATSEPVTLRISGTPQEPGASQTITAAIDATAGALTISVDPEDRAVVLPAAQLDPAGERWESRGELRPVTVADTRGASPGWSASGQLPQDFTTPEGTRFAAGHLGWTPQVLSQGTGQGVTPGPEVAPRLTGTTGGLGESAVLGAAPDGAGRGTAKLGAGLRLSLPTETLPGTYTATLTLTAI